MAILEIITDSHPFLRKQTEDVEIVNDDIKNLMYDMLETMYHSNGIGLAANQVHRKESVIVIDTQKRNHKDKFIKDRNNFFMFSKGPLFIANPKIKFFSKEQEIMEEGCLSLPNQCIKVSRPSSIILEYLDINNKKQELHASGLLARVCQHEFDHLQGKLLIDYLLQDRLKLSEMVSVADIQEK